MNITEKHTTLLWHIFWSFCKISPVSFGGGYAMIPAIEKEIVENRQWMDEDEMSDVLSIAGSSPGGIGVNASTLTGYRLAGLRGAIAAVLGISLPNFIIMLALTIGYSAVQNMPKVTAAFEGIHAAVVAFIAIAGWRMWRSAIYDKSTLFIVIGSLCALLFSNIHPALLLLIGTLLGIAIYKWQQKLGTLVTKEIKADKKPTSGQNPILAGQYIWGDGI
ncbi:chromate transporter [Paenibacillus radicis (ex Xue et al. 2023)]|uniref:Chromate transporter n=1 Tax=Paenibacillus radicis (ex Xue et al. 2023) TaxID=2972489 RepID=A0ABT1YCL9_9BACL|nr:chromate transporter [Paenibacillus radicis (ex Xue et al. 2023)]MCR8629715.1 chromate transporter [Paenibacillus radicis (ex Xue et al. 2023)]